MKREKTFHAARTSFSQTEHLLYNSVIQEGNYEQSLS